MSKEKVIRNVAKIGEDLRRIALEIWNNPETSHEEFKSSALEKDYLKSKDFSIKEVPNNPTSFIAEFGSGKPIIGLLGEYDALPKLSQKVSAVREPLTSLDNPGHGCGHNLLGVGSLGAAVAVKEAMEAEKISGTVRYYGCAAEETLAGKGLMAKEGVFDDLDCALTWHPTFMNTLWGCSFLAMNSLKFRFKGIPSHAAAAPDAGRSALDAVELMDVGANFMREHLNEKIRIHYTITNGGGLPNTVPADAEVWYYVRAPKRSQVKSTTERLIKIAHGAAEMTETEMSYELLAGCYDVISNHTLGDVLLENMNAIGGPDFDASDYIFAEALAQNLSPEQKESGLRTYFAPEKIRSKILSQEIVENEDYTETMAGSTDVGDVSYITPVATLTAACWPVGVSAHTWIATASTGSPIGVKAMFFASKSLAATVYDLFKDPALVVKAREEFKQRVGAFKYVSAFDE